MTMGTVLTYVWCSPVVCSVVLEGVVVALKGMVRMAAELAVVCIIGTTGLEGKGAVRDMDCKLW